MVASAVYSWTDLNDLGWDVLVPETLEAYYMEGDNVLYSLDLQFSVDGHCNFDEADEYFEMVQDGFQKHSVVNYVVMQGF